MDERDLAEKDPLGQQVGKCMEMADYIMINDSTRKEFLKKIQEVYDKICLLA